MLPYSLWVGAVAKPKDGELQLAQASRRQLLSQQTLPKGSGIGGHVPLSSGGYNKDGEGVPCKLFLSMLVSMLVFLISKG